MRCHGTWVYAVVEAEWVCFLYGYLREQDWAVGAAPERGAALRATSLGVTRIVNYVNLQFEVVNEKENQRID